MGGTKPKLSPLALTARASQLLILLGAPLIFLHCVDYVVENSSPEQSRRVLSNVDLFSGEGAINKAFNEIGEPSKAFDKETHGNFGDITTVEGFLRSIQLCLQLRPHGLCTAGPPCGSFVFLNMGTSLRSKTRPLGGPWSYVRLANLITCRMTLLLLLCFIRCATFLVEQPVSTLMTFFPYIRWLEKVVSAFFPWLSTHFYMGSYGHSNLKPTKCFGPAPWSYKLRKKITKKVRRRAQKAAAMVKKYKDKNGKVRVCGNPVQLRKSQIYPMGFGRAVCSLHTAWMETTAGANVVEHALYPPRGSLDMAKIRKLPKAPYRWRHACLSELKEFLIKERLAGRYHPVIKEGLDD